MAVPRTSVHRGRAGRTFVQAFLWLIVLPFVLALLTRGWAGHRPAGAWWLDVTASLPMPLLAVVLLLIAASQVGTVVDAVHGLGRAAAVFVLYLAVAAPFARLVAGILRLGPEAGRTLAFNVGSRNSFVVLPLALALPAGREAAVAVIVLQSIVELAGLVVYLWWVPGRLFGKDRIIAATERSRRRASHILLPERFRNPTAASSVAA